MSLICRRLSVAALAAAVLGLAACTSASVVREGGAPAVPVPLRSVACVPGGGVLAEEVAAALRRRGIATLAPAATAERLGAGAWAGRAALSAAEAARLEGVEAVLLVRATDGPDGHPLHATVLLQRVPDASVLVRLSWRNGEGARAGSLIDRWAQLEPARAAEQIAAALLEAPAAAP